MVKKFEIGKIYKTRNDEGSIDFTYKVLDIKEDKIFYEVIENRSTNMISIGVLEKGIKEVAEYSADSQFVRNSELVI